MQKVLEMKPVEQYIELFGDRDPICVSHYPVPIGNHKHREVIEFMGLDSAMESQKHIAVYIHIPFCEKVCSFCPFNKYLMVEEKVNKYLNALYDEMDLYAKTQYGKQVVIESVNFGGGTPTALSGEQLAGILEKLQSVFQVSDSAMIFVEGNPKNFTLEKLQTLRKVGLNRISVGVQTFQQKLSDDLELFHSIEDSESLVSNARQVGVENIGIDLMYNLPGQTETQWRRDIERTIELGIDHVCLIAFCIVPKTRIHGKIENGDLPGKKDIHYEVKLYEIASQILLDAGYEQYSVIDFALPGKIDRHAHLYFGKQADLIGLGAAAFGFINGYMYINNGQQDGYYDSVMAGELPVVSGEKAAGKEMAHGAMAKGLRMLSVDRTEFKTEYGQYPEEMFPEKVKFLEDAKLITKDEKGIHLTEQGIIWGNNVSKVFFSDKYKDYGFKSRMKFAKGKR
jgi:oxygen-independent coproporphyrinogen-3 oxidase